MVSVTGAPGQNRLSVYLRGFLREPGRFNFCEPCVLLCEAEIMASREGSNSRHTLTNLHTLHSAPHLNITPILLSAFYFVDEEVDPQGAGQPQFLVET